MLVGIVHDLLLVNQDRLIGLHRKDSPSGRMHGLKCTQADCRYIETHVLLRLCDFDDGEAPRRAKSTGTSNTLVGSFHRLDCQDGSPFDHHALTDVHPPHFLGEIPCEGNVLGFVVGQLTLTECPCFHE